MYINSSDVGAEAQEEAEENPGEPSSRTLHPMA